MRTVLELKQNLGATVLAALGMHPAWITQHTEAEIEAGLEYLSGHLTAADTLGEVGLDYKWATTEAEKQQQAQILDRQLQMAAAHGKAINMHSRRCQRQVMERAIAFRRETGLNVQPPLVYAIEETGADLQRRGYLHIRRPRHRRG